jgi:hypothetical protein
MASATPATLLVVAMEAVPESVEVDGRSVSVET